MDIQKAVSILDQVIPQYLDFMQKYQDTYNWIDRVFQNQSEEARNHLKDQWHSKEGRFDDFYLNLDDHNQRTILEAFDVAVEPDKYDSSLELDTALIKGADPWDCHPFETYLVFVFLRFAYNNSLDAVKDLNGGQEALKQSNVSRFGNGENWGKFYQFLLKHQQDELRYALINMILAKS